MGDRRESTQGLQVPSDILDLSDDELRRLGYWVVDRTIEHLVGTDMGIIVARQRLLNALQALTEKGVTPPGVDLVHQRVRSASLILPPDLPFKDGAREALVARPEVAPVSV